MYTPIIPHATTASMASCKECLIVLMSGVRVQTDGSKTSGSLGPEVQPATHEQKHVSNCVRSYLLECTCSRHASTCIHL